MTEKLTNLRSRGSYSNTDTVTYHPELLYLYIEGVGVVQKPQARNPLFYLNAGTGKDISIKELANLIAHFTDFKGDILWDLSKPDGTFKKLLNISRIKSIGWEPKISLKKGIKKIIKDFPNLYEKKLIKL